jgi:prevent-host-death family protein
MRKLSTGDAREKFAEIVSEAAHGAKRTIITRHGKEVAAVVPITDLKTGQSIPPGAIIVQQSPQILNFSAPCKTVFHLSVTSRG